MLYSLNSPNLLRSGVHCAAISPNITNLPGRARMIKPFFAISALLLIASQALAQTADSTQVTLLPGDAVKIQIWREPDLSGEFIVDEQGVVTFPLLGKRNVTQIPVVQLRDRLTEEYAKELKNPSVTITPLRRVYVMGEVNHPGLYTVDPTISLAGAVALAGGATPLGNLDNLRVVRKGTVILEKVSASSTLSTVDIRSDDQVFVDRRGWFDRNSTFAASALLSIATLAITLLVR